MNALTVERLSKSFREYPSEWHRIASLAEVPFDLALLDPFDSKNELRQIASYFEAAEEKEGSSLGNIYIHRIYTTYSLSISLSLL